MKKLILSLVCAGTSLTAQTITTDSPFEKLTPFIEQKAEVWVEKVTQLNSEQQQIILNLLALLVTQDSQEDIAWAKHLENSLQSDKELLDVIQLFNVDLEEIVLCYAQHIDKKMDQQQQKKQNQEFWIKMQQKVVELTSYFSRIYYNSLYDAVKNGAKDGAKLLTYMFNAQGKIKTENRSKALPIPTP